MTRRNGQLGCDHSASFLFFLLFFFRNMVPSGLLKQLSLKTAVLMLLLSSQRGQTIMHFNVGEGMEFHKGSVGFRIDGLKTSKPVSHVNHVFFKAYPVDRRLWVVTYLKECINRTHKLRFCTQL